MRWGETSRGVKGRSRTRSADPQGTGGQEHPPLSHRGESALGKRPAAPRNRIRAQDQGVKAARLAKGSSKITVMTKQRAATSRSITSFISISARTKAPPRI